MRIAAIDIGTNSIHMIVVRVRPDLSFEVIDREKEMVRLGAGGLDGRSLTPTAMTAALQTLAKFRRLADAHKVDEIVAAATSAIREADNGGDFIAEVARQTGIQIRVISGTEEARLIHMAAVYGVHIGGTPGRRHRHRRRQRRGHARDRRPISRTRAASSSASSASPSASSGPIRCRRATSAGWSSTSTRRSAATSTPSPTSASIA